MIPGGRAIDLEGRSQFCQPPHLRRMASNACDAAFEGESCDRYFPSFIQRADEIFSGNTDVVEEHLVEMVMAVHNHQRPNVNAWRTHVVQQQITDTLMLRSIWISAREQEHPIGELR